MIEIELTDEMKAWSRTKAEKQIETEGFISKIDTHESVYIGYLGEAAWWKNNPKATHIDGRDYDFKINGLYYDVKSYWSQYRPRPGYTVYVPAENLIRGKGFYSFVAVLEDINLAILIGEISCQEFREKSEFRNENQDKIGRSGQYLCDCYELYINQLNIYAPQFADRPCPISKPGDCLHCESMGGWKPYSDISMYCFYSAKILKKARPPVICIEAMLNCPMIEQAEPAARKKGGLFNGNT